MSVDPRVPFGVSASKYLTSKSHSDPDELSKLVEWVQPSGGALLDIATGAGHLAYAFATKMDRVVALDPTPEMLAVVKHTCQNRGIHNIETCLAYAEDLPFLGESFAGVGCRVAPHHFRDVSAFLTESYRVLKPGGWFLLVDTTGINDDPLAHVALNEIEAMRDPSHVENLSPSAWTERLEQAGFTVEETQLDSVFHEIEDWMTRMNVVEPTRSVLRDRIRYAEGALGEYFDVRIDEDGTLSFRLHQFKAKCRKPA